MKIGDTFNVCNESNSDNYLVEIKDTKDSYKKIIHENGKIIFDEEYEDSCRITLEKTKPIPYSITCGV